MNRLKQLRSEFGYTVRDVAELIGSNRSSISFFENERRDMSTAILVSLSDLLQVTIDYLICHTDLGIYVNDCNNQRLLITESQFQQYKSNNQIIYKDNKRYLDTTK